MRRENDAFFIDGRDALADLAKHLAIFLRRRIADCVGHVDGGCARIYGDAHHFD